MRNMQGQQGFTLIELVIVIIILGILAATALPRFANVTEQAHTAAVQGAAGGLGTAVQLVRAQWVANGEAAGEDTVANFGAGNVSVTDDGNAATSAGDGWPTGTAGNDDVVDDADCVAIWGAVMQNPPTIRTSAAADNGEDYTATGTDAANTCLYTYNFGTGVRTITYDSDDGSVVVAVP